MYKKYIFYANFESLRFVAMIVVGGIGTHPRKYVVLVAL